MKDLLIIIPAYNEAENLPDVIKALRGMVDTPQILVVDDGSLDDTFDICRKLGVKAVRHKVNLGLSSAIRTGMQYALVKGYRYAMQFDADGQHDASYVKELYDTIKKSGGDIVIGSRYLESKGNANARYMGGRVISGCIRFMTGKKIKDPTSGMRVYSDRVMKLFTESSLYSPEPDTLSYLIKKGFKVSETGVEMKERMRGKSYLDIVGSARYMFRMCTSILFISLIRS
ncbi:MAG: glycosyltransferase family 2 protein [Lachnospiraceae bacterium]|nr:glycosyltransferase family 2 protein [Lachnospiraceae bacterium]